MENWRRNETPLTLSMAVTPMFAVRIGIWSGAFCRGEGGGTTQRKTLRAMKENQQ